MSENNNIEFGRIKIDDKVDIVIRKTEWKEKVGIDIRTYLNGVDGKEGTFTGWSKNGIRVDPKHLEDIVKLLNIAIEADRK